MIDYSIIYPCQILHRGICVVPEVLIAPKLDIVHRRNVYCSQPNENGRTNENRDPDCQYGSFVESLGLDLFRT